MINYYQIDLDSLKILDAVPIYNIELAIVIPWPRQITFSNFKESSHFPFPKTNFGTTLEKPQIRIDGITTVDSRNLAKIFPAVVIILL